MNICEVEKAPKQIMIATMWGNIYQFCLMSRYVGKVYLRPKVFHWTSEFTANPKKLKTVEVGRKIFENIFCTKIT